MKLTIRNCLNLRRFFTIRIHWWSVDIVREDESEAVEASFCIVCDLLDVNLFQLVLGALEERLL